MDKLIVIATLFAELLAMLICWYSIFKKPIKIDFYFCGLIIIEIVIMFLIYDKNISRNFLILEYSIIFIYFLLRFKMSIVRTSLNFLYGLAICASLEIIIAIPYHFFRMFMNNLMTCAVESFIMLIIMYVISTKISKSVKIIDLKRDKKLQLFILIYAIIEVIFFAINIFGDIQIKGSTLAVGLFIFIGYFYYTNIIKIKIELERTNAELKLNKIYGEVYSELVFNVRKRQHDFKNQLNAIYSMHLTASSLDELVLMQKSYSDKLINNCKYDSILTKCSNKILAGYLYSKCLECENSGIDVEFNIYIYEAKIVVPIHELIEVIGILINNACEATFFEEDSKKIRISIIEDENLLKLSVSNISKYLKTEEINRMFDYGVSSKGSNRGIGLPRLKELAKQYNIKVIVENILIDNSNWINFQLEFKKSEDK